MTKFDQLQNKKPQMECKLKEPHEREEQNKQNDKKDLKEHEESQYLQLINNIIVSGTRKPNRTGIDTLSLFGAQMRFNLKDNVIPVLTTKKVFWRGVVVELLWIISGCTDSNVLKQQRVNIWNPNGSRGFLDSLGFVDRREGDLGPVYGFQWRHFGATYRGCDENYTNEGVDQLNNIINLIKQDPSSRRMVLCSWNAADLKDMALPPCHCLAQFNVTDNKLSCMLYQRSADLGLGVPFNIASYALLTHMIAHITGTVAHEFVHTIGDAHVYVNHIEPLKEQLDREPYQFPKIEFVESKDENGNFIKLDSIEKFTVENIVLNDYVSHKAVKMEMAV